MCIAAFRHVSVWWPALTGGILRVHTHATADLGARVPGIRVPVPVPSFVNLKLLSAELAKLPTSRLLYGRFLKGMPGGSFDKVTKRVKKWDDDK